MYRLISITRDSGQYGKIVSVTVVTDNNETKEVFRPLSTNQFPVLTDFQDEAKISIEYKHPSNKDSPPFVANLGIRKFPSYRLRDDDRLVAKDWWYLIDNKIIVDNYIDVPTEVVLSNIKKAALEKVSSIVKNWETSGILINDKRLMSSVSDAIAYKAEIDMAKIASVNPRLATIDGNVIEIDAKKADKVMLDYYAIFSNRRISANTAISNIKLATTTQEIDKILTELQKVT